ncbi:MAG TPA: PAS domain S-box protein [Stellaceae bacterium]|nr:PAS domain S-box protein [Stellaceae bacterium]
MASSSTFEKRYRRSLAAHLEGTGNEDALDIGRSALEEGRTLLDVMTIHQATVPALVKSSRGAELRQRFEKSDEFLSQAIAPFEMINRGWREIVARLRGMNETLERQVAERTAALSASEQRFRDIAEVAGDWIWESDGDHRFTFFAGESLENMAEFGSTPRVTIGKTRWEAAGGDPERDERWRRHKEDLDTRRSFRNFRYAFTTPSGTRRYMVVSGKPILGPNGEFLGYRGTATDETAMVEALQKAERAEALLRDAVESIAEGFVIFDRDDRFVMCNEIYRRTYTYGRDLLVPGAHFEDVARAIVKMGQIPIARGREDEWVEERLRLHQDLAGSIEQQLPDGRWLLITERRMADGGTAGLRVDITALKETQAALSESEQMARGMIDTALDAFVQMDEAGLILEWNPQAEATFGWSREEAVGKRLADLIIPSSYRTPHATGMALFLETGSGPLLGNRREMPALRRDGSEIRVEVAVTALRRHRGYVFNGFLRDVTEQRAAEIRLQQLQTELLHVSRFSAMGQMGSALAHEINQPLAAILNYLGAGRHILGMGSQAPPDKIREILDKAVEQATRAGEIIRQLRSFVAKGETQQRPEILSAVVEEASTLAMIGARQQNVRLTLRFDPQVRTAMINRIQIQQVVVNLVRNAVEAMAESERRELAVSTRAIGDGSIEIEIADSGPGLAPEVAAQLFKPFVSTKSQGMGVGLSICQSIVEAHGGRIWAEANPGGGTVFRFTVMSGTGKD